MISTPSETIFFETVAYITGPNGRGQCPGCAHLVGKTFALGMAFE